jgi:hypothetical protein
MTPGDRAVVERYRAFLAAVRAADQAGTARPDFADYFPSKPVASSPDGES